jgi:UDP-N-acetylmuramoylalanine--D-glutamate ligase
MNLANKRVAVVGLGESGRAAADLCLARDAEVVGHDEQLLAEALPEAVSALRDRGLSLSLGSLSALEDYDLIVVSPGVPPRAALDRAEAAGVEVIGELELASHFLTAPIVLIGGTNGKSTVTALVGEMLAASGRRTFVGGNFGTPLIEAIDEPYEVIVAEISSFQAERVPTLHATAHALLNVSEDHLDRYPSFEAYAEAKGNPFASMTGEDWAIVPVGDRVCERQARRGSARLRTFGLDAGEVRREGDELVDRALGGRFPIASLKIRGLHNLENACAAIATARAIGVREESVAEALAHFSGLPHRHALVAEFEGVRFYDDSKATNVGAAVAALRGLEEPRAVLIAGGRDKMGSYAPLVAALREKGRALVLIGEAAPRIREAAEGVLPIVEAASMAEAVVEAARLSKPGDAVLLSPACSSFDMFTSYAHRGDVFAAAVRSFSGGPA